MATLHQSFHPKTKDHVGKEVKILRSVVEEDDAFDPNHHKVWINVDGKEMAVRADEVHGLPEGSTEGEKQPAKK